MRQRLRSGIKKTRHSDGKVYTDRATYGCFSFTRRLALRARLFVYSSISVSGRISITRCNREPPDILVLQVIKVAALWFVMPRSHRIISARSNSPAPCSGTGAFTALDRIEIISKCSLKTHWTMLLLTLIEWT